MKQPEISIVIPLYNEQEIFPSLIQRLEGVISNSSLTIEVVLIDDGSQDDTANLIRAIVMKKVNFKGVILSRNFGHQIALSAGIKNCIASEAIMVIDGDLQDPPELLPEFYELISQGYDVVYAVRKNRKESIFKRFAYKLFYRFFKKIANIYIPLDSGDFSMISRKVANLLNAMPEESRFIRGMRSWVGFKQIGYEYNRDARAFGESKYSFKALLKLALNGIFNFSEYPVKFIINLGFLSTAISGIYLIYVLIDKLINNTAPPGFTAIVVLICLFGGIQLIAIGIIGEYLVRIFFQSKGRPLYVIDEVLEHPENN